MALSAPPKPVTSDAPSWRRAGGGELTPASRGSSRVRGGRGAARGGRGVGSGPRVGLGAAGSDRPAHGGETEDKRAPMVPGGSAASDGLKSATADVKATANQDATTRPRAARKGSRQVSSLTVDPSVPSTTDTASTAPSTAPLPTGTSRRRRSGANRHKASSSPVERTTTSSPVSTRHSPQAVPISHAKKGAAINAAPAPAVSVVSKDLPPHLSGLSERPESQVMHSAPPETTAFDSRAQIESLVDKMRANAIHRPYSPASHIDWAGDDDDELPDLDDWGYGSKTEVVAEDTSKSSMHNDVISPILEGSLKTLPVLEPESEAVQHDKVPETTLGQSGTKATAAPPVALNDAAVPEATPRKRESDVSEGTALAVHPPREEKVKSRRGARTKGSKAAAATAPSLVPMDANSQDTKDKVAPDHASTAAVLPSKPEIGEQVPLHPSLPPKPASVAPEASRRRSVERSAPAPLPIKSSPTVPTAPLAIATTAPSAAAPVPIPTSPKPALQQGLSASIHAPKSSPEQGLAASMHAPKSAITLEQGVSASMHAPKPSIPQSAPSPVTTNPVNQSPPDPTPSFNHHQRSKSRPVTSSVHEKDASRSPTRPLNNANHSRTQSTPANHPRGASHTRSPGNVRPVITGHALSQLMRTLGGPGAAPRGRAEAVTADK